jgi:hypothetical protein
MLPREGHLKAVKRILSYFKTFSKGRVIIDTSYPDHSVYPVEDHSNWMEFYPDAGMTQNAVWIQVKLNTLPSNIKPLSTTWVMKKKAKGDFRARITAATLLLHQ